MDKRYFTFYNSASAIFGILCAVDPTRGGEIRNNESALRYILKCRPFFFLVCRTPALKMLNKFRASNIETLFLRPSKFHKKKTPKTLINILNNLT